MPKTPNWSIRFLFEVIAVVFVGLVLSFHIEKHTSTFRINDGYADVLNDLRLIIEVTPSVEDLNTDFIDPWGNQYKYRDDGLPYSCGVDGISSTQGDGHDDINSWNSKSSSWYQHRAQNFIRQQILNAALVDKFPVIVLGLGSILVVIRVSLRTK